MRLTLTAAAAALSLCLAAPAGAIETTAAELKADIDALLQKLESGTQGFVKWEGADRMDVRQQGNAAVADIANARILLDASDPKPTRVTVDRIELRRSPGPDNSIAWALVLPGSLVARDEKGQETKLALKDGAAKGVVDAQTGQSREFALGFASARIDDQKTGGWLSFGPLSASSKLTPEPGGGWAGPMDFELKGTEFFFTEGPVGGAIARIAYTARSSGPDFAALNRFRARIEKIQQNENAPPADRLNAFLEVLPELPGLFAQAKGEMSIENVSVRAPTGEALLAFDKASFGMSLTGLKEAAAALRITLQQDGLKLSPSVLETDKVPRRVVVDFGLEEVDTAVLLTLLEIAGKARIGGSDADQQRVQQRLIGAAAKLNPVVRIYELAADTSAIGLEAKAEARGSPRSPKGYKADADISVRGFDALAAMLPPAPLVAYLPLLKELGTVATGAGGAQTVAFHLASAPPKWLTLNGQDISTWFAPDGRGAEGRKLRPADPAMTGNDVRAVQQALAAAKLAVPQNGTYDAATAVAVARYQKQQGLNVDGVVDAEVRRRLGVKPQPAGPEGPKTRAN
jgi:hypothetical protein